MTAAAAVCRAAWSRREGATRRSASAVGIPARGIAGPTSTSAFLNSTVWPVALSSTQTVRTYWPLRSNAKEAWPAA